MTSPLADSNLTANSPSVYTDLSGLSALKRDAKAQSPEAVRKVAQQFESIFAKMVLSSMRQANFGDSLFGSDQQQFYQGMFDDQLAVELSKGKGLGLADMLVQQLTRAGLVKGEGATAASEATAAGVTAPGAASTAATAAGVTAARDAAKVSVPAGSAAQSGTTSAADVAGKKSAFSIGASTVAGMKRDFLFDAARGVKMAPSAAPSPAENGEENRISSTLLGTTDQSALETTTDFINKMLAGNAEADAPKHWRPGSPEDFVQQLWPCAEEAGKALGVDPKHLLAQAALETGWGKSLPCDVDGTTSFNFFGIKAGNSWQGDSVSVKTLEFEGGVPVPRQAKFRAYDSAADSFRDYVEVLRSNPRFAAALNTGSDAKAFANALQKGGYATDPRYAMKIETIAQNLAISETALKSATGAPMTSPMDVF
jgi:peptidoglycan hydrolase FlgJ